MIDLPALLMKHKEDILALPYYTGSDNLIVSLEYRPSDIHYQYHIWVGFVHYEHFCHKRWSGKTPEEAYEGAMNDD